MSPRCLPPILFLVWACLGPARVEAGKRPLLVLSVETKDRATRERLAHSSLSETLTKRLIAHLELMGERPILPSVREAGRLCDRDCQVRLAQRSNGDILRAEVLHGVESYDLSVWLWRFDNEKNQPATEYPIEEKAICEGCSESRLIGALCETAGRLLEASPSRAEASAKRPASSPETEGQLSFPRRLTAGLLGAGAALSLGAALVWFSVQSTVGGKTVDPLVPGPALQWDFSVPAGAALGVASGLAISAILTAAVPSRRRSPAPYLASRR